MSGFSQKVAFVIDSHVHPRPLAAALPLESVRRHVGLDRMNLACITSARSGEGTANGLVTKAGHPGRYYCFGGLNHATFQSGGRVEASLSRRVDEIRAAGCDGIKLIEGKGTWRRFVPEPLDGPYYADFFAHAEELDMPLLWHVADPEEFWDPALTPPWAVTEGWNYTEKDVPKETLYREVANVLARHPGLRVVFAHFYFLSADLPRAERFFAEHPRVNFDLALGVELLYNLSRDPAASRVFFIRHADRIFFGSDIMNGQTGEQAAARTAIVRRFLETADEFTIPPDADPLLDPGNSPPVRGLSLPLDVLTKIYGGNFQRFAGADPRPTNFPAAVELCRRDAAIAAALGDLPADATEAGQCAKLLEGMPH